MDVIVRILNLGATYSPKYSLMIGIAAGVMFIGSVSILSARKILTQRALFDIPKLYMPINKSDLPAAVYQDIQDGFSEATRVRSIIKPRDEDRRIDGYGRVAGRTEPVHFKSAVIQSLDIIESVAATRVSLPLSPTSSLPPAPPDSSSSPPPSSSSLSSPSSPSPAHALLTHLAAQGVVDAGGSATVRCAVRGGAIGSQRTVRDRVPRVHEGLCGGVARLAEQRV
ncbi:hypothetical protein DFJ73DRAFT_858125, partial [Zopfochytrium polystomum]